MAQPADWYADPSGRYSYRYWDGTQWTNQVSSGGPSAVDPNPLNATIVNTPPAPGSKAAPIPVSAPPQPTVQVSQSGGNAMGMIIGVIIALIAVIVLVVVLMSGSDDDTTDTTVPDTTEAPATTEAPPEE